MDPITLESGKSFRIPFFNFAFIVSNRTGSSFSFIVSHSDLVEPEITILSAKNASEIKNGIMGGE